MDARARALGFAMGLLPGRPGGRSVVWGALAAASLTGCFSYVPADPATVPVGEEIRAHLTRDGLARLEALGREDLDDPVVAGTLVRRSGDRLSLRIPVSREAGFVRSDIAQQVTFALEELLRVDRRRLDPARTGLALAGAAGAATALVLLIMGGSEGEDRLPPPGGPDDLRIPLVSIPLG